MGFLDDIEDVTGLLNSLNGFLRDAGLGNVVEELEHLADQASRLKQELAAAASSTHWSGAAADGFRARAQQREDEVAQLVAALHSAHSAVGAAYAVAGIF
jgi:uncharacterized protein YukE